MTHLICGALHWILDWTPLVKKGLADAQSFSQRREFAGVEYLSLRLSKSSYAISLAAGG